MSFAHLILAALVGSLAGGSVLLLVLYLGYKVFYRSLIQQRFGQTLNLMLSDKYSENVLELWSAVKRFSVLNVIETGLRAQKGTTIERPLGSPKNFPGFDNLMFVPAQLARLPHEPSVIVDTSVVIGANTKHPVRLAKPLIVAGMGYGISLSEKAKLALAQGSKQADVALNSGEGPYLKEERDAAGTYIRQISRAQWGRDPEGIEAADMIELAAGHGSHVGAHVKNPFEVKGKAQKLMGLSPIESAITPAVPPEIKTPYDIIDYVKELRGQVQGKPLGIKIMGTGNLEKDLAVILEAGFDFVAIGGCEGGTSGALPTYEDDYGIPSILALVRAVKYLESQGARKELSIIISGGFYTPGDCLKALALGADAVALGTVPLFALVHGQVEKAMPWEPLTQLVWYDGKYADRLDVNLAARSVSNVLNSFMHEIEGAVRTLGKKSIREVGPNDLVALDQWSAEITGVRRAW